MKATFYIEGTNTGAKFLEQYIDQTVELESLYKNIDVKSPPLANLRTSDNKQISIQLIDVRFVNEYIFIHCFVTGEGDNGGKALIRLKPL